MNVTLVYPCLRNSGWNSLGKTSASLYINHGIASLAACLQKAGHIVCLLDLREMKSWNHFERCIAMDQHATIYGISMATLDYHEAVKAAKIIRKVKPNSMIVAGGPHPSICPEDVAEESIFDYIIKGEGEISLVDLVNKNGSYPRIIQSERPDLEKLPMENREVFNMQRILNSKSPYDGKEFFPMPFINVISGRGCVYKCGFCKPGEDLIFGKFRMRSFENFTNEIAFLHGKYHFQTLMIDDDSFTLNHDYLLKFCDWYGTRIQKPFICQSRVDFITRNPDIVKRMRQAGLDTFIIGFESGTQRMLDLMHKDTTVAQNYDAAEICIDLGIKMHANFIVGLPTETKEEMLETFSMIKRINPWRASGAFFTPIVGTELFDYCKENNILLSEDPAILGSRNPSVPKIMGPDYKWMSKQMYPHSKPWRRFAKKGLRLMRRLI